MAYGYYNIFAAYVVLTNLFTKSVYLYGMLASILWVLFAYIMYQFLKKFVIPVVGFFWKIRKQMSTLKKNYTTDNQETEENKPEKKVVDHPAFKDEYIDFEEVKKK